MSEPEIRYQEASLDVVMGYYAEGFKPRSRDEKVCCVSWHIDTMKKTVLFKLRVERKVKAP